ncbi:MAG: LUD domain-containing protein [Planctomycetes bacterium]|nr:LUD domain-containing protein [Planctomycetota bacterium]
MSTDHDNPTLGTPREEFLGRVRTALGRSVTAKPPQPPKVDESIARLARPSDDLVKMFIQRANLVGMKARAIRAEALTREVLACLAEVKAKRIVVSVGTIPQALGLKESMRKAGHEVVEWQNHKGLDVQFDTDAGVTDVHAALAETGTMVVSSDAGHSRGLSLVPPVHVGIVRKSDILPDMLDYWARFRGVEPGKLPANTVFITGPSKTADIEGVLVTGVHGPGVVFVLIVEDA